jgi:ATP-dependent Clp protease ATP-binding subunit ClpX
MSVELKFTDKALRAVAQMALKRKTGARGLRGVLETSMLDIMYDIPSKNNVKEVLIDEGVINDGAAPLLIYKTDAEMQAEEEAKDKTPA